MLEKILPKDPLIHYSTHVWDKGIAAFKRASRAGEEGVMAKLATSRYHSGKRSREWLKVKSSLGQEVVIVGFTAPQRSREYFGSLLLAVRDGKAWRYVGRAGSGFDREMLKSLHALMVPLITTSKPVPEKVPDATNATWIKPKARRRGEVHRMDGEGRDAPSRVSRTPDRQEGDRRDQGRTEARSAPRHLRLARNYFQKDFTLAKSACAFCARASNWFTSASFGASSPCAWSARS